MEYEIKFYKTTNGRAPVEDFIKSLQKKEIAKVLRDLDFLKEIGTELQS